MVSFFNPKKLFLHLPENDWLIPDGDKCLFTAFACHGPADAILLLHLTNHVGVDKFCYHSEKGEHVVKNLYIKITMKQ